MTLKNTNIQDLPVRPGDIVILEDRNTVVEVGELFDDHFEYTVFLLSALVSRSSHPYTEITKVASAVNYNHPAADHKDWYHHCLVKGFAVSQMTVEDFREI